MTKKVGMVTSYRVKINGAQIAGLVPMWRGSLYVRGVARYLKGLLLVYSISTNSENNNPKSFSVLPCLICQKKPLRR
jgi:hypothetical protein